MSQTEQNNKINTISRLLEDLFEVGAIYEQADHLVINLSNRFDKETSIKLVSDRLELAGYTFKISDNNGELYIRIDPKARLKIPTINIVLFLVTLLTVYVVPVLYLQSEVAYYSYRWNAGILPGEDLSAWESLKITIVSFPDTMVRTLDALAHGAGIQFTLAMISILFVHEMGHFVASRRRKIITSWPYFIPAPNIIGTFGAIIKAKSPFWNRRDLIEVGAAGPIAGWLVAIAWLWYGLSRSVLLPQDVARVGDYPFYLYGESLLMRLSAITIVGQPPANFEYLLTEAAFAGWVGLLVTAINLLPIGQLDGGHIIYGLGRRWQYYFGMAAMGALLVMGYYSPIWWVFAAFGLIFGVKHPPTLNDYKKPGGVATGMGILALIVLVISFTPIPFGL
ncbi:MAG: site-2 protease family protein [Candidatus Zixiibacteriota bacterium]